MNKLSTLVLIVVISTAVVYFAAVGKCRLPRRHTPVHRTETMRQPERRVVLPHTLMRTNLEPPQHPARVNMDIELSLHPEDPLPAEAEIIKTAWSLNNGTYENVEHVSVRFFLPHQKFPLPWRVAHIYNHQVGNKKPGLNALIRSDNALQGTAWENATVPGPVHKARK